jgi:hypothetical protein
MDHAKAFFGIKLRPPAHTQNRRVGHPAIILDADVIIRGEKGALHIETAVREISKNVARMVVCMWMASLSSRALSVLYLGRNLVFGSNNGQKYTPTPTAIFRIKLRPRAPEVCGSTTRRPARFVGDN